MMRLLLGGHTLEFLSEECPGGARRAFIDWDAERNVPLGVQPGSRLANISMAVLLFDAQKRVWRLSCVDTMVAPSSSATTVESWNTRAWAAQGHTHSCLLYTSPSPRDS